LSRTNVWQWIERTYLKVFLAAWMLTALGASAMHLFTSQYLVSLTSWKHEPNWQMEIAFFDIAISGFVIYSLKTRNHSLQRQIAIGLGGLSFFLGANHLSGFFIEGKSLHLIFAFLNMLSVFSAILLMISSKKYANAVFSSCSKRQGPKEIHTHRLVLRPIKDSDMTAIFEYSSLPEVAKFTTWEVHQTIESSIKLVEHAKANYQRGLAEPLAITLKSTDKLIGTIGWFWNSERHKSIELAFALSPEYWGQGIVLEACRGLVNSALKENDILRITSRCMAENTSSSRVMEKLGMDYEGMQKELVYVKGRWVDMKNYCILSKNWKS
jgi:[ribosomal protein S5]-alanine N-acetyltransferase